MAKVFTSINADAVTISYNDLVNDPQSLRVDIERAFGSEPDCLGIVVVKDLPEQYPVLRETLLKIAYEFASLPDNEKEKSVHAASRYRCATPCLLTAGPTARAYAPTQLWLVSWKGAQCCAILYIFHSDIPIIRKL